jgi:hypothetical protein
MDNQEQFALGRTADKATRDDCAGSNDGQNKDAPVQQPRQRPVKAKFTVGVVETMGHHVPASLDGSLRQ